MSLTQQLIQLLSESPGNVIYHLISLFALQVVFALSFSQWRRVRQDQLARRMSWASGGILVMRVGLLLAGLVVYTDQATAVSVLPPLEQAVNTATAVLIVWALAPNPTRQQQLGDTAVVLLLLVVGMMYIFFAQSWPEQALSGVAYSGTTQAMIWDVFQIAVLVTGLVLTLAERPLWLSLRQIILLILLAAYLANFFSTPQAVPSQTDIAYWVRLGYLLALPLWAVLAYRHSITQLLSNQAAGAIQPDTTGLPEVLTLSTQVISSLQPEENVKAAMEMASRLLGVPYTAVAVTQPDTPHHMQISSQLVGESQSANWLINLREWPALQQALDENEPVELRPSGLGGRQLRLWYEEMGLTLWGALLVLPLQVENATVGLLILSNRNNLAEWDEKEKTTAVAIAGYIAQVLHNSQTFGRIADQIAVSRQPNLTEPTLVSGRLIALEEERNKLQTDLETTTARLAQAESQAAKASKQARDLAATLEELEKISYDERLATLETEIETLRESLIEAEEAMALAAAGEKGLSTEWIMTTITRYSSQLEAAQARIETLEADLMRQERGVTDELVVSLAQELRTPMTSIAGYTDLLLSEMLGALGAKQRDFLQRVKANVERMDAFLDLIVQLTTSGERLIGPNNDAVDIQASIDTAVSNVITQIREKNLRLDLDAAPQLPTLSIHREALQQILNNLVGNACQASPMHGRVAVHAHVNTLQPPSNNGHSEPITYLHLAVSDSGGGIQVDDRARVFNPQHRADDPLIDGLGDTGAGLAIARTLAEANGGRVWIESQMGEGSTFSVLFPLPANTTPTLEAALSN
ncbi:MAG: GAF domain-containing protein [Anaerolineales bacterium]|nr:GAF domain-containing protein [Anaerolineales bacterium]